MKDSYQSSDAYTGSVRGQSPSSSGQHRTGVLVAFACVYFFWGSTYTAIHVAGLHLAPPLVGAARCLLSTLLLVVICVVRGTSLRVSRRDAWRLALVGCLFMSANNVLLTWAETMVPSGLSSLVVATMPLMVAVIEALLPGGEALNLAGWAGLLLGSAGMAALVSPSLRHEAPAGGRHLVAFFLLLLAAFAFALGSVLSRRFRFQVDAFAATTWQIGAATVVNLLIALLGGNLHTAVWTRSGLLAISYLAVFGSIVGLTCLTYLLQHVPVTKVSTYAFVNPVVAVLLGIALLGERLSPAEVLGMITIVGAVALVILARVRRRVGTSGVLVPEADATA